MAVSPQAGATTTVLDLRMIQRSIRLGEVSDVSIDTSTGLGSDERAIRVVPRAVQWGYPPSSIKPKRTGLKTNGTSIRQKHDIGDVMIKPRILLLSLATSVILFLIAMPFGSEKNHHSVSYEFGNVVWVLFLVSLLVLIVLTVVFLVQRLISRSHDRKLLHGS
jgi:hypothetical protein